MLSEALQRGWCFRNPANGITHSAPVPECVDPSRVLATAEAARVIDRADGMFRIMLLVALRTGLRQRKQLALTWGDVTSTRNACTCGAPSAWESSASPRRGTVPA